MLRFTALLFTAVIATTAAYAQQYPEPRVGGGLYESRPIDPYRSIGPRGGLFPERFPDSRILRENNRILRDFRKRKDSHLGHPPRRNRW